MPSTIRDVARAAGVSVATVSRVFNDSGPVGEATRRSVIQAAHQLHYAPNTAARALSLRRTHAIGVVLPELRGHFFTEVIRGIDQVAQLSGCHLMVASPLARDLPGVLRGLRGRVDGLVLLAPDTPPALLAELPPRLPLVLLESNGEGDAYETLAVDDYGGAYRMLSHLLALGHRRIAVLAANEQRHGTRERLRAYRDALAAHDVAFDEQLVLSGDGSEAGGSAAVRRLHGRNALPDAIFALTDAMAAGALGALRQLGARVPDDVALAGFDDAPIAALLDPPLTTVRADIGALGARAAHRLCELMDAPETGPSRHEVLPTELVVRASCGARPPQET